jgi:hypothetical protein
MTKTNERMGRPCDVETEGFRKTVWDNHNELKGLNQEAAILAAQIQKNFEELRI